MVYPKRELLRRKGKLTMGTDCTETTANLLSASDRYLAARKNAPSERRIGRTVKPLALVLCIGGLVTSVGYGQAPQDEDRHSKTSAAVFRTAGQGLCLDLL